MSTPAKPSGAGWSQSQNAWIEPGKHLQVVVPMCKQGRLLSIEFEVLYGLDVDFDVMFEAADSTATRLYGPTRRARGVTTVLELPSDGDAYVTFDNISSWVTPPLTLQNIHCVDCCPMHCQCRLFNLQSPECLSLHSSNISWCLTR